MYRRVSHTWAHVPLVKVSYTGPRNKRCIHAISPFYLHVCMSWNRPFCDIFLWEKMDNLMEVRLIKALAGSGLYYNEKCSPNGCLNNLFLTEKSITLTVLHSPW